MRGGGPAVDPVGSWFVDFDLGSDENTGRNLSSPFATTRNAFENANSADTVYYRTSSGDYRKHPASIVTSVSLALWLRPGGAYETSSRLVWEDNGIGSCNNFVSFTSRPAIASYTDGNMGVTFDGTLKQVLRCGALTGIGKSSKPCALIVASINSDHPTGTPTLIYLAGKTPTTAAYQVFEMRVGAVTGFQAFSRLGSTPTASQAGAGGAQWANGSTRLFMGVAANASDRAEAWEANTLRATASSGASGGIYATPTHAVIGSGDEGGGTTRWFDGTIGEIQLWTGKPTTAELDALYDQHFQNTWPTIYAGLA